MNKALAVIGCIIETAAIEGADFIQQAIVDCGPAGKWQGVVGKEIAVGVTSISQQCAIRINSRS